MPQKKPDWFKMNPAMFLQDSLVEAMTTEELGMTFRLLCRQWIDGWIPDDLDLIARLCRVNRSAIGASWDSLLSKFFPEIEPGKRANRFMWQERELVIQAMSKKQTDGRIAVTKRWDTIRSLKEANRVPIGDLIQEKEREREREIDVLPLTPSPSVTGKRPRKTKSHTDVKHEFTVYPDQFETAVTEWRELRKFILSPEIQESLPLDQRGTTMVVPLGSRSEALIEWNKWLGSITPDGIIVTHDDILEAVRAIIASRKRSVQRDGKANLCRLCGQLAKPIFKDAIEAVIEKRKVLANV